MVLSGVFGRANMWKGWVGFDLEKKQDETKLKVGWTWGEVCAKPTQPNPSLIIYTGPHDTRVMYVINLNLKLKFL